MLPPGLVLGAEPAGDSTDAPSAAASATAATPADYAAFLAAVAQGPSVRAARARWQAAREDSAVARTWPDPMLTYGYTAFNTDMTVSGGAMMMTQKIMLEQRIPFFGKLADAGRIADQDALIALSQYRDQLAATRLDAQSAWLQLYQTDASLRIMHEQAGLLGQIEDVTRRSYATGAATLADALQARQARDELQSQISDLRQQRADLVAQINALRALPPDTPVPEITAPPPVPDLPPAATLQTLAAQNHPALKQAGSAVRREELAVDQARRDRWPDLTVGVDYQTLDHNLFARTPDNGRDSAMLFVSVDLPIHRDKYRARERGARQSLAAAQASLDDTRLQISARVRSAWLQAGNDRSQINLYRQRLLPTARDRWQAALNAYTVGQTGLNDVLDSEQSLLTLRLGLVAQQTKLGLACAQLERLAGVALDTLSAPATPTDPSSHD